MWCRAALLCLAVARLSLAAQPAVTAILRDAAAIRQAEHRFWAAHGLDAAFGGLHGTLALDGSPVAALSAKGLVQEARHAWAFSLMHAAGYRRAPAGGSAAPLQPGGPGAGRAAAAPALPTSRALAQSAFAFTLRLHNPDTGLFAWNASRDGRVLQHQTVLYGQHFVLYAFSQYYTTFGDARAYTLALRCFRAVDAAWHDPVHGGFKETKDNGFPPSQAAAAAYLLAAQRRRHSRVIYAAANPSAEPKQLPRSLNILMHGTEALTALHRMTHDAFVLARLLEHLDIICTRLTRSNGLLYEDYLTPEVPGQAWPPAPKTIVSYGHNLESTWLVLETLDYLLPLGAISRPLASRCREGAVSAGAAAVRDGYDSSYGGVFEDGSPTSGPRSRTKVWWVQAESMLALWKLHAHFAGMHGRQAEAQRYLAALAATARFVRDKQTDVQRGGQYWQVDENGSFPVSGYHDRDRDTKGNRWKAAYHAIRSALLLEKWVKAAS